MVRIGGFTAALALAFSAAAGAFAADLPAPKLQAGFKVPRLSDGRPELEGIWTNATTTKLERPASFGDRLMMTPQELAEAEKATQARNARQNAPTSQEVIESWKTTGLQPDTADECRSGSRGAACGYNASWTDPGDLVMRVAGQPRTSFITFPANGRLPPRRSTAPPLAPAETGEAGPSQTSSTQNDNPEGRSLPERCILMNGRAGPVMTPGLYNNTYRIVQTADTVAIWIEMIHDVRLVRIGAKPRADGVRTFLGDSVGWWDGDTLVVETSSYRPDQFLHGGDQNLKLTERFTRVSPERLHYAFKVEDPTVWTEAWGGEYEFGVAKAIYEYACHEGNYGLENILAGAREEEQAARAAIAAAVRP